MGMGEVTVCASKAKRFKDMICMYVSYFLSLRVGNEDVYDQDVT
ncbi:hypothetical protein ES702_03436 [subsurface metagenome]